jgi:hypothetical protein
MKVNDNQLELIKDKIPKDLYDELDMRKQLSIMNEVMKSEGNNIIEKFDNTIDRWYNVNNESNVRYKLKYKY